jgi:hypothetical protein
VKRPLNQREMAGWNGEGVIRLKDTATDRRLGDHNSGSAPKYDRL